MLFDHNSDSWSLFWCHKMQTHVIQTHVKAQHVIDSHEDAFYKKREDAYMAVIAVMKEQGNLEENFVDSLREKLRYIFG